MCWSEDQNNICFSPPLFIAGVAFRVARFLAFSTSPLPAAYPSSTFFRAVSVCAVQRRYTDGWWPWSNALYDKNVSKLSGCTLSFSLPIQTKTTVGLEKRRCLMKYMECICKCNYTLETQTVFGQTTIHLSRFDLIFRSDFHGGFACFKYYNIYARAVLSLSICYIIRSYNNTFDYYCSAYNYLTIFWKWIDLSLYRLTCQCILSTKILIVSTFLDME